MRNLPNQAADTSEEPPHSLENEQGVLGCILEAPVECLPKCLSRIPDSGVFYDGRHREIYQAILSLHASRAGIDTITVCQILTEEGYLNQIGGVSYLIELKDVVPSVANLPTYLDVILEKYERRRNIDFALNLQTASRNGKTLEEMGRMFKRHLLPDNGGLPSIADASKFLVQDLPEPPQIVKGVIHQGCKVVLGGASKSHKSWVLLDLGLSVSAGVPWLGFGTTKGKVLFVNFELPDWAIQKRLNQIAKGKSISIPAAEQFQIWNLRGHCAPFHQLIPMLCDRVRGEDFGLIILDPSYKLLGQADENSARDIAQLLNSLDELSREANAALAFAAHFAKGNASGKEAMDRISGSGVFARDPDAIMVLTGLQLPDAFRLELILRNMPPQKAVSVKWEFPLMVEAPELDTIDLKKSGPSRQHDLLELLAFIQDSTQEDPVSVSKWSLSAGIKRETLRGYLETMRKNGWIETVGSGTKARKHITLKGRESLGETNSTNTPITSP